MNKLDKYCSKIQKETEKILYKVFWLKISIKDYIKLKNTYKDYLEKLTGKDILKIDTDDIKLYKVGCLYAKYKTLEKILNIFVEASCLSLSDYKID